VKDAQEEVVKIFEYLVITNKTALQPYFREVPFLPDEKPLANIRKALQNEAHRNWRDSIEQLLLSLKHESLDVRVLAIQKLLAILVTHKVHLQHHYNKLS